MKWKDFKDKYPEEIYRNSRALCEEIHKKNIDKNNDSKTFCDFCYNKQGESCFPCGLIREAYLSRYGFVIDQLLSTSNEIDNNTNKVK
ncbi:MAG: hypothetical protein JXA54_01665 [Candidatus Heimdallarchaeota archaeon]|nr:hypothetical protein [Candidatus Heimdallarchaeota archaeon]